MMANFGEEEGSYDGGGSGRFANNEDPDDHSPDIESTCNKTGQDCPGHRGGSGPAIGDQSAMTYLYDSGLKRACRATRERQEEGGGLSNFLRAHGDPGLPPGARCEGNTDSKRYKKEHPKLCHEIESRPWEPAEAFCATFWWANPWLAGGCAAGGSAKYYAEHH